MYVNEKKTECNSWGAAVKKVKINSSMAVKEINENIDYLYKLQKDETEHQNHRLMWILTAQALIFAALCTLLSNECIKYNLNFVITNLILVGVLISISGIYSMLISQTSIGVVYELWDRYNKVLDNNEKREQMHHLISLAPSHFLVSRIKWLMFYSFAPNVFCAAWINLVLIYCLCNMVLINDFKMDVPCSICTFFIILFLVLIISHYVGKYFFYHWGYDQYKKKGKSGNSKCSSNQCKQGVDCTDSNGNIIYRGIGNNKNSVIQNSFNNYGCCNNRQCCLPDYCITMQMNNKPVSSETSTWSELRIYHIFVDRFNGGWTTAPTNRPDFIGGNINGIIDKIDYIKSMGYNAIMLTPIFKSAAYHGYHVVDYYMVDERFGTWDDFDKLVSLLHEKGMKLICDYVPNHCHITHPRFQDALNNPNSNYRSWFYFDKSKKGEYVSYQNYPDLPKFNLYDDAASDYLISVATMLAKRKVDGLRIDHVIGIPFSFLRKLRCKVKEINPDLFLFGEAWMGSSLDYSQIEFVDAEQKDKAYKGELSQDDIQLNYVDYLDGVLDFSFRNLLVNELIQSQSPKLMGNKFLEEKIKTHFAKYPDGFQLILFLDNHDTNRFLYYCKGNKFLLEEGLNLCANSYSKPYVIYYGTEKGMTNSTDISQGGENADLAVREPMAWDFKLYNI